MSATPKKTIRNRILFAIGIMLFILVALYLLLFPPYPSLPVTGEYPVKSASYTIGEDPRRLTIEFWYPDTPIADAGFPLVVFSHGAFGFRGSNYSTFMELASNGYVVCSIDHTGQSIFTKHADGSIVIADLDFLQDATAVQAESYDDEKIYTLTHQWLDLRVSDFNTVLDFILKKMDTSGSGEAFQLIDPDHIGVFGHSLGGAAAAEIGRSRTDIDAVVVLDGTMIGEGIQFRDGREVFIDDPYPLPILDIYNEEHYQDALENSSTYANMVLATRAVDSRQIVFQDSGHLNFTDLPLFSPLLAKALGIGEIDRRYCIETMNQVLLSYFDHYLKGIGNLDLESTY